MNLTPLAIRWMCPEHCRHACRAVGKQPQAWRSRSGFTLIELLVTLVVLAMVAVLSLPYASGGRGAAGLASDSRELASRFRAAREMALASRSGTTVIVDLVKLEVHGPGAWASYRLNAAERVTVQTAKGQVTGQSAQITFGPDGASSGGVVVLKNGARARIVRVEWLTGTVSIGEAVQ